MFSLQNDPETRGSCKYPTAWKELSTQTQSLCTLHDAGHCCSGWKIADLKWYFRIKGTYLGYIVGMLTTLEKRFGFSSEMSGKHFINKFDNSENSQLKNCT